MIHYSNINLIFDAVTVLSCAVKQYIVNKLTALFALQNSITFTNEKMDRQIQLFFIKIFSCTDCYTFRFTNKSSAGRSMKTYEKISSYIRTNISKNDRDFSLLKKHSYWFVFIGPNCVEIITPLHIKM